MENFTTFLLNLFYWVFDNYNYDLNRCSEENRIIEYIYDSPRRRIAKIVDGTTIEKYLWQGLTRLLAVYDGSNNLIMRFEYADGRMPVAMTRGGYTRQS